VLLLRIGQWTEFLIFETRKYLPTMVVATFHSLIFLPPVQLTRRHPQHYTTSDPPLFIPRERIPSRRPASLDRNLLGRKRAFRNVLYNVQNRYVILEKSDIVEALSRRLGEYPAARAGGDVAQRARHHLDRIIRYLNAFLGAIHITERYNKF